MQLKDPGPSFGCELFDEPNEFSGVLTTSTDSFAAPLCTTTSEDCQFFNPDILTNPLPTNIVPVGNGKPCDIGGITIDGIFDESWLCVKPAKGQYSLAYFAFLPDESSSTGFSLFLLNDWVFGSVEQDSDCFNEFTVFTAGGSEKWMIRVYVDQTVEVTLNNVVVQTRADVTGRRTAAVSLNLAAAAAAVGVGVGVWKRRSETKRVMCCCCCCCCFCF